MELSNGLADLRASMTRAGVAATPDASRSIYLHPGQLVASAEPRLLSTILGSCVAVCLWDLSSRVGGMVHFLLPEAGEGTCESSARYGDVAVPLLIRELKKHGGNERFMKAKLYGGGCVLRAFRKDNGDHLGARNVNVAKIFLQSAHIAVVEENTLGNLSRKVTFDTGSGIATLHIVKDHHGD